MQPAIRIQNLSKCYRINHAVGGGEYRTFRETLTNAMAAPIRHLRQGAALGETEEFWALKDVDLEIQPGEVVGLIGRNGAGKSTLLKILSRITPPSQGEVVLNGRVGSLLEVGTGFHPELTGRENIYLNGSILGMRRSEIDRKFDEIVEFSGVNRFLDTPTKRYSSGMKVRLAFAVAAHLEPEIVLVDEVLAVGDAQFQRKCLGKMSEVARSGRTVVFVSHNMGSIASLCNRGAFLESGRLELLGTQDEAIAEYLERLDEALAGGRFSMAAGEITAPARMVEGCVASQGEFQAAGYPIGATLEFRVRCYAERTVHCPALGIGIDNAMGQRLLTLHSSGDPQGRLLRSVRGEYEITCRLKRWDVVPGDYRVKFSLQGDGETFHVLDPAFSFTVLPTDFYGNGGRLGRGLVVCPHEWGMES